MTIKYDNQETDSIYVVLLTDKVIESEETSKDVIVDYNESNEVVAIDNFKCKR